MAINANTTWEVRTGATAADQGGGFRASPLGLAAPSAPTVSATAGGSVANNTYYVVVNYVDALGREGVRSAETSVTTNSGAGNQTISVTSPAASTDATHYSVYIGTASGGPYFPQTMSSPASAVIAIGTNSTRTTTPATSGVQVPGVDYSQQNGAQVTYTDIVLVTGTTMTSAGNPFTTSLVGNILNITGGTGFTTGRYQITGVSALGVATVDRAAGTPASTGGAGKLGGALQTISDAESNVVAGNTVFVLSGTYAETVTTSTAGGSGTPITVWGYKTTRWDNPTDDNRPLIDGASTRATCITNTNNGRVWGHLRCSGATGDNISLQGSNLLVQVKSSTAGGDGVQCTGTTSLVGCELSSNTATGLNASGSTMAYGCYAHDNTGQGFSATVTSAHNTFVNCISDTNAAMGFGVTHPVFINCTSYGNTGASTDGFEVGTGGSGAVGAVINSISATNGRYGFSRSGSTTSNVYTTNNDYNGNSTDALNSIAASRKSTDSTSDPTFTNAASGDFSIGTALKALGWPGVFPGALSTGYLDMGAVQRQESSTGGEKSFTFS